MDSSTTRKVRDWIGEILGLSGFLLVVGSIVWFVVGPERIEAVYEYVMALKWALLAFLIGLGLIVVACVLSPGLRQPGGTAPTKAEQQGVRCPKCQALNDDQAKFCDQCGTAV
jgi:hypothetical protein